MDLVRELKVEDEEKALKFLGSCPESNVVLMHNIERFGMARGSTPFGAFYFGRIRSGGRLSMLGALYGLGNLWFYSKSEKAMEGVASYLHQKGNLPRSIEGKSTHARVLISELSNFSPMKWREDPHHLMVATKVKRMKYLPCARPAREHEIPRLLSLTREMEIEQFGSVSSSEGFAAELLSMQINNGTCFVVEQCGEIVSKAEATLIEGKCAWLYGVYTSREVRGCGYGTCCVASLCVSLLGKAPIVSLAVGKGNYQARSIYRKIGFRKKGDWLIASTLRL